MNAAERAVKANPSYVEQEIRYVCGGASEVELVWEINNGNPAGFLPVKGSYVKDGWIHTPMIKNEDYFSAKLKVAAGSMLDYVFRITGGPLNTGTDILDNNEVGGKNYQTLTANKSTTIIESGIKPIPKASLTVLDFSFPLLVIFALMLISCLIIRNYCFRKDSFAFGPKRIIIASAITLFVFLVFARAGTARLSWDLYLDTAGSLPQLLWAAFYDLLYVNILAFGFLFLVMIFKYFPRIQKLIAFLFSLLALVSLAAGILNTRAVELLDKPFNYQWLYNPGFLDGPDAKSVIFQTLSNDYILRVSVICATGIIGVFILMYLAEFLSPRVILQRMATSGLLSLNMLYLFFAWEHMEGYNGSYSKLANPVMAFFESPALPEPKLMTMAVEDSLRIFDKKIKDKVHKKYTSLSKKIKNVIVYVLESTGAEYVQPYDQKYKITPFLDTICSNAIVFENVYAHSPVANKSMVSILGSVYPGLSCKSITEEYSGIPLPTISSELKNHGYRTAFFNPTDPCFQNARETLTLPNSDLTGDFITNDVCTATSMIDWIKQDPAQPFFSVMWSRQTSYPYYTSKPEEPYVKHDTLLNRYLNAVHNSDKVLGDLVRELKKNGLFESTLLVVVSNHGETFGEHGQVTHASRIYEENIHVPCVLINPYLKQETVSSVGGLVDLAPTIFSLLNLDSPESWQGHSLLASNRENRVFFFTSWSDDLFGYREGARKYIFNATGGATEVYDLEADKSETKNIAASTRKEIERSEQILAAWVQYQHNYHEKIYNSKQVSISNALSYYDKQD